VTTATQTTERLTEITAVSGKVDKAAGIIRGVRILGRVSKNNREYSPQALKDAAKLYENIGVFVDHSDPGARRSYRDKIGTLRHAEVRADGVWGDLHYNPRHALAEQLGWDAEHNSTACGLSHDAQGVTTRRGNTVVVESISRVTSVDLVASPASVSGLFESVQDTTPKPSDYVGPGGWGDLPAPSPSETETRSDDLPGVVRDWQGGQPGTFREDANTASKLSGDPSDVTAAVKRWSE